MNRHVPNGLVVAVVLASATLTAVPRLSGQAVHTAHQPLISLSTLNPKVGQEVFVGLNLPTGEGWRDANIGLFSVRIGGKQRPIPVEPRGGEEFLRLTFDRPGYALLMLSAGPGSPRKHSDSWQPMPYYGKAVLRVSPRNGVDQAATNDSGSGILGKVGQKLEVLHLVHPSALRAGDDLPVRLFYDGAPAAGIAIQALVVPKRGRHAPPEITENTTDPVGATSFNMSEPGQWLIRCEHAQEGVTHLADLTFELQPPPAHQAGPKGSP